MYVQDMGSSQPWGLLFSIMQQSTMERQSALEAEYRLRQQALEAEHREQIIQRDIDMRLMRMKADQDMAAERARNRALQDANMKALMNQFFQSQ